MLGAAVLTCEQLGLSWSIVNLSTLKKHATGKGNAKKPEMHAAAKLTRTSSSVWDKHTKHLSSTALRTMARHYTLLDLLELRKA
jgi:hypothetical protein